MPAPPTTCPHCGAKLGSHDAYCTTCGMTDGPPTCSPWEAYLRAHIAAVELLRQTSQHVRPCHETIQSVALLEAVIKKITPS